MQLTFGDAGGQGQRKRTRKQIFLAEMEQVQRMAVRGEVCA